LQQPDTWITWVITLNRNGTIPFVEEEKDLGQFVHDLLLAPANTHLMGVNEWMNPANLAAFIGEASGLAVNYKGVSSDEFVTRDGSGWRPESYQTFRFFDDVGDHSEKKYIDSMWVQLEVASRLPCSIEHSLRCSV